MDNTGHYYNATGELVPAWTKGALVSPTTVLNMLRKPELEAYRQRVGEVEANKLMVEAQERGTRVHKACELYVDYGDLDRAIVDAELGNEEVGYLISFAEWLEKNEVEVIETELFVSSEYGYAGRLDLIVKLDGDIWIVDIKTGAHRPSHGLQLKFYEQAYKEATGEPSRMGVLRLTDSLKGRPTLREYSEPRYAILAHLAVYDWWRKKFPMKEPAKGESVFI